MRRQLLTHALVAVVSVVLVWLDYSQTFMLSDSRRMTGIFVVALFAAITLSRNYPLLALGIVWFAGFIQLVGDLPPTIAEITMLIVLFYSARYGQVITVIFAGISIPLVPIAVFLAASQGFYDYSYFASRMLTFLGTTPLAILVSAMLAVPWLIGLTLRFLYREQGARQAEQEALEREAQAHEIARLEEAQNQLARDVHDVVGHSLAVILAQAESAQFIDDSDAMRLKEITANIAESARTSLRDVRDVLTDQSSDANPMRIQELIANTSQVSGGNLHVTTIGQSRPLPPEIEQVAYRVLQEMFTNALKHGKRNAMLELTVDWSEHVKTLETLRYELVNEVDATQTPHIGAGSGIAGMRRRIESIRGRIITYHRERDGVPVFITSAWLPIRDTKGSYDTQ